jgi:mRNA interferase RelE/StbE
MGRVLFSRDAIRALQRMPINSAELIRSKIAQLSAAPDSLGNNVKALKGHRKHYRLRVGDWRIVFRQDGDVLHVLEIGPRGSIYD